MKNNEKENQFTSEEIYNLFKDSDLNEEFKNLILIRFNSLCQAMYNCVKNPERTMKIQNTYGDNWVEEHNRVATEYQRYNTVMLPPYHTPQRTIEDFKYPMNVFVFYATEQKIYNFSKEAVEDCIACGIDLNFNDQYIVDEKPSNFIANSFDDIVKYYEKNKEKKMRFGDKVLNDYFGINKVNV